MDQEWVIPLQSALLLRLCSVDFDDNNLNKEANALQKEITAKKKVCTFVTLIHTSHSFVGQGECR